MTTSNKKRKKLLVDARTIPNIMLIERNKSSHCGEGIFEHSIIELFDNPKPGGQKICWPLQLFLASLENFPKVLQKFSATISTSRNFPAPCAAFRKSFPSSVLVILLMSFTVSFWFSWRHLYPSPPYNTRNIFPSFLTPQITKRADPSLSFSALSVWLTAKTDCRF